MLPLFSTANRASRSIPSPFRNLGHAEESARECIDSVGISLPIVFLHPDGDCSKNDAALDCFLPVGADVEEGKRGPDRT